MSLLVRPSVGLYTAWREAYEEWGDGLHEDGFGLLETDDVRSSEGFREFVDRLSAKESSVDDGATFRWIVEDGKVLGGIALRHESGRDVDVLGQRSLGKDHRTLRRSSGRDRHDEPRGSRTLHNNGPTAPLDRLTGATSNAERRPVPFPNPRPGRLSCIQR